MKNQSVCIRRAPLTRLTFQRPWLAVMVLTALGWLPLSVGCDFQQPPADAAAGQPAAEAGASDSAERKLPKMSEDEMRFAAYDGKLDKVKKALASGTNVNAAEPSKSLTALHMAAYNGHSQVVALLIENGATLDSRDDEGKTPLLHACTGPFAETVKILVAAGADVNARESTEGFTPLMMAAGLGQLEVVQVLLDAKADKTLLDDDQESAADHARNSQHADIVALLEG